MKFKILPTFPPTKTLPGSQEKIANAWPLPRSPEEVHPEGIPILFREEEVAQFPTEPIAWPPDEATLWWITEDVDKPFPVAPEEPDSDQTFEF